MEPSDYLFLILLFGRFSIGVLLIKRVNNSKNPQLKLLSYVYFVQSFSHIFNLSILLIPGVFYIFWDIGLIIYAYFVDQTFFKNQKSPFNIIVLLIFIFSSTSIFFEILGTYYVKSPLHIEELIGSWSFAISTMIVNIFLLISTFHGYKRIKFDVTIEPWIKIKYRLIFIYCICYIISVICWPLAPEDSLEISLVVIIGVLFNLISIILEFITWGILKRLKVYFNRNFVEELPVGFNYISFLGKIIAERFDESILKCTGLIRLSLKDYNLDIATINFDYLHKAIDNSLRKRLNSLYPNEVEKINEIITELHQVLTDKQSVLIIGYA
ncbi:MAG: hypothetical protein GY870_00845 [archaeon]|nr:hypothetical protein [archaeon]